MGNILKITPIGKYKVKVLEDYKRFDITVPRGYEFNGASIPRIFWIFFHPFMYLESSVIHDICYDLAISHYKIKNYDIAHFWFKKGDELFLKALKEDDPKVSRLFYNAVRIYRKIRFWRAR